MKRLMLTTAFLLLALVIKAQTVISGKVTDLNGQPLAHVSVMVEGTEVQTVTNEDGQFTLKMHEQPHRLRLSHIGYKTRHIALEQGATEQLRIRMQSNTIELSEVLVSVNDPLSILKAAMARIEKNYPNEPELMRCFYRETARRGSRFISVAEAVTEMYKSDYHSEGQTTNEYEGSRHAGCEGARRSSAPLDGRFGEEPRVCPERGEHCPL